LGIEGTQIAKKLQMSQPGVAYAVRRGNLVGILSVSENLGEFCNASQSLRKTIGKHQAFPIAIGLVESGDMVNNAHPPHLSAHSLKHTGNKIVFITERC